MLESHVRDVCSETARWLAAALASTCCLPTAAAGDEPAEVPCPSTPPEARIHCELDRRFAGDAKAATVARELYDASGWVAGVEGEHIMDGGWRGRIRIVPEPPKGKYRYHLTWVAAAAGDFHTFFAGLEAKNRRPLRFRWRDLALRFFRSVKRRTPSGYASNWSVAYNVNGSLFGSASGVRNTLFHEIFHLNDEHHGWWCDDALTPIYERIIARCLKNGELSTGCLTPYAPGKTKVKGSTYYAFHPGEGVEEYAAELGLRYFLDTRRVLAGKGAPGAPFKCRTPDNREAWKLISEEFFGGVDLLPACE